ncbi:hypothetical protein [Actinomadura rugatobispora]|uniref:TraB/GumN family protein n=1 Tax=Actinomadura rugatobispora TaxID=1994 RepID=A0ABW0ZM20_9ACTN|nr:hypothetical protein GCM10010200_093900 [Actinomadura rugatobispora]
MQFIESSVIGLRAAVITMGRRTTPLRFVLFPMVHVGERSFYDEVAARASSCDLIVAEGGPSDGAPMQRRMAGLRWDGLVDQMVALDLEALGVPIIWEGGTAEPPEERARRRAERSPRDRIVHTALDSAAALALRALGRYGDPRDLPSLDQNDMHDRERPEGRIDRFLDRKVGEERDERLVRTLGTVHRERYQEPIKVAVVWGAAHMTAVVDVLRRDFRYYVQDAEWITIQNN